MNVAKEKYFSNAIMKEPPEKKLKLVIKDGSITESKFAPELAELIADIPVLRNDVGNLEGYTESLGECVERISGLIADLNRGIETLNTQINGYSLLYLSEAEYQSLVKKGKVDPNTIYFIGEGPKVWGFGDSFPVVLSGDSDNWKFGNAFPVVFV